MANRMLTSLRKNEVLAANAIQSKHENFKILDEKLREIYIASGVSVP